MERYPQLRGRREGGVKRWKRQDGRTNKVGKEEQGRKREVGGEEKETERDMLLVVGSVKE